MRQKGNVGVFVIVILVLLGGTLLIARPKGSADKPLLSLPKPLAATQEKDVHSGDGTMKLIVRERQVPEGTSYSFFTAEVSGQNEKQLFTKTASAGAFMAIHQNGWAPDNKYVFIQDSAPTKTVLVFKVSGEPFADGEKYVDVGSLFAEKQPKYQFKEVTGWDGPDTLHVTSVTPEGAKGPSFWFIVSSRAFLQLY